MRRRAQGRRRLRVSAAGAAMARAGTEGVQQPVRTRLASGCSQGGSLPRNDLGSANSKNSRGLSSGREER